ncbi:nucleoside hydrolase [Acetobacteraceae bacterium H6797]|nr:nucleoside hydrolase [Acetobacteraceae bacterium H6797]
MPIPVIIDCDPGTDDALALFLALGSPELDVRMVTVAGGNVGLAQTLPNARAIVGVTGKKVPVIAGADRPLLGAFRSETAVHGTDGLGGVRLPEGPPAAPGIAADAIRAALREAPPEGLTLIGLGPATNLALALATEPALVEKVARIVLMTGAWGEGNFSASAEFNAMSDPEGLAVLLACGRPVTLVTLDLTAQALVTAEIIEKLRQGEGECRKVACDILAGIPMSRRFGNKAYPLHDPCAIAWLVAPELFTNRDCHVVVECGVGPGRGRTHVDRWDRLKQPANATVAETIDAARFFEVLDKALGRLE